MSNKLPVSVGGICIDVYRHSTPNGQLKISKKLDSLSNESNNNATLKPNNRGTGVTMVNKCRPEHCRVRNPCYTAVQSGLDSPAEANRPRVPPGK